MARSDLQVFPEHEESINPFINNQPLPNQNEWDELKVEEKEDDDTNIKTVTMSDIDNSEETPYPEANYHPNHNDFSVPYKPTIEVSKILNQRNSMANQEIFYNNENMEFTQSKPQTQHNKQPSHRVVPERELDISNFAKTESKKAQAPIPSDHLPPKSFNVKINDFDENKRSSLPNIINPPNSEVHKDVIRNLSSGQASSSSLSNNDKEIKNEKSEQYGEKTSSAGHTRQSSFKNQEFDKAYFQNISPEVLEILGEYHERAPQQNPFGELPPSQDKSGPYPLVTNNTSAWTINENYSNSSYDNIPRKEDARSYIGRNQTEFSQPEQMGFQKFDYRLNTNNTSFPRGDPRAENFFSDSLEVYFLECINLSRIDEK